MAGRAVHAELAQAVEIVGADRFFEPPHVVFGEAPRPQQRLFAAVGAVGVDEQLDVVADGRPGRRHPAQVGIRVATHLHLG
ncbi:hypothetical protein LAUMK13_00945 [Mycobacterium innocens]|uniref:Uncharacterized protein n=1 Tax=Mycobacterium innocens TaxID=2341083 RepID=A0A498PQQ4_9MYCO|nr:hypothetical protein LAUMK13_00945 [Mycobacterium innocens]